MENKKVCSFYVSEYHLLTILLPYINEKIIENKNVEIFAEEDMIDIVKRYLRKNEIFENIKIIKLGWKKSKKENVIIKEKYDIAIVIGKEKYIEEINYILNENRIEEIVNCFNIENLNNLKEIVMQHDFVLKTEGKSEVLKSSHNEQKRKTIQTQI